MRKAIDRNAKQDKDLFSFTKQLDKERKMVIEQLSMKKDNFKKEMIKRRESLSNLKGFPTTWRTQVSHALEQTIWLTCGFEELFLSETSAVLHLSVNCHI